MAKLAVTAMFAVTLVSVRVGGQNAVAPVDEVVAGSRHRRDRRAARAVVDRLRGRAGDRTVGARRVGQGVGVDGEVGRDGDVAVTLVSVPGWPSRAVAPVDEVVARCRHRRHLPCHSRRGSTVCGETPVIEPFAPAV